MTTFRCPYCKQELGDPLPPRCPQCDKMLIRKKARPQQEFRTRKKAKLKIQHDAQRQLRTIKTPDVRLGSPKSLFAVLIVLAVMGSLIAARLRQRDVERPIKSLDHIAVQELEHLRMALELFRKDCRRYPTTEEGLKALVLDPGENRWSGSYLTLLKPDPWKKAYQYGCSNDVVTLFSSGLDGVIGTQDDLQSLPPNSNEIHRIWVDWHTYR